MDHKGVYSTIMFCLVVLLATILICVSFVPTPTNNVRHREQGGSHAFFMLGKDSREVEGGEPTTIVPFPRKDLDSDDDDNDSEEVEENGVFEVEMVSGSIDLRDQYIADLEEEKSKNKLIAVAAAVFGASLFFFNKGQVGVNGIALLHAMENDSTPLAQAMCNGRPTVVDFYADWCESCKAMAPTMREMEIRYKDKLNFVTIDGTKPGNADLVDKFKVDGIPQIAFVTPGSRGAEVLTNLVGAVPKNIMKEELNALLAVKDKTMIQGDELPYLGFELKNPYPLKDFVDSSNCGLGVSEGATMQDVNSNSKMPTTTNVKISNDPTAGLSFYTLSSPSTLGKASEIGVEGKENKRQNNGVLSDELNDLLKTRSIVDVLQGVY